MRNLLLAFVLYASFLAQAQRVTDYDFPLKSPGVATATAALLTSQFSGTSIRFKFRQGREDIPFYGQDSDFHSLVFKQSFRAPVVYVIPGLGGNADSASSGWLAEKLFNKGFHVVTLPSPFSWSFSISGSSNGIIGYLPRDTRSLYTAIQRIEKILVGEQGLEISRRGLIGYSMGAITIAHLMDWDRKLRKLNFKRALMINPPVNLEAGIKNVDSFYDIGDQWSSEQKSEILNKAMNLLSFDSGQIEETIADDFESQLDMAENEVSFLIGFLFRFALTEIVHLSQEITDLGVLQTPAGEEHREERIAEAEKMSFTDYIEKIVYYDLKLRGERRPLKRIIAEIGLFSKSHLLKNNKNLYLMHNEDDFLLEPGDTDKLLQLMPGRARIYPYGGHVGNIWFEDNLNHIYEVFADLGCEVCQL